MGYLEDRAGLAGKVAVVTGGAGGLGWPISRDLARAGVHVAVCDRDPEAIRAVQAELGAMPVKTLLRNADVREPEAMAAFFEEIDAHFGRVDILVNVPGGGFVAPLMDTNVKGWNAIIRQNFLYVLDTTQHAVRRMRAQKSGGSLIYVTSIEAERAVPNRAIYGAMKAGVTSLAKTLALELGQEGIRVNTVAPDTFPTPAVEAETGPKDSPWRPIQESMAVPMGRYGEGEELSSCVLFLASNLASYVTGAALHVDGGTYASSGWLNWPDKGWVLTAPADAVAALFGQD